MYKFTVGPLHAQIGQCEGSSLKSREGETGGGEIEKTNRRRGGPENEEVKGEMKSEARSRNGLLRWRLCVGRGGGGKSNCEIYSLLSLAGRNKCTSTCASRMVDDGKRVRV